MIYIVLRHDHYDDGVPLKAFTDERLADAYVDFLEEGDANQHDYPHHKLLRGYSWHVVPVEFDDWPAPSRKA